MTKYEKFDKQTEKKSRKNWQRREFLVSMQVLMKFRMVHGMSVSAPATVEDCLYNLALYDNEFIVWFRENYINKYNQTFMYANYISALNYLSCTEKSEKGNLYDADFETCLKSFLCSGLIKKIDILNGVNIKGSVLKVNNNALDNVFVIMLPSDEKVMFSRMTDSQKDHENACGHCYAYSEELVNRDIYDNAIICCGYYKDQYDNKHRHAFVVSDGYVYDFSNNIRMSFVDYVKLFDFEILYELSKEEFLDEIIRLGNSDAEYDISRKNHIQKIAISMMLKKK